MSLSGGKSKTKQSSTQNQTSTTALTDWSRDQWQSQVDGIMGASQAYTSRAYQPYTGQMVAGLSDNERRAREMVTAGSGADSIMGDAVNAARAGGSMTWTPESVDGPERVNYRTFDAGRVQERMNPYEQQVVAASDAYWDEQLGRRLSENQARATQSGAFGGGRHGIAEAELMRTSNMDRSQRQADLRYRGYNDAMAADERESNSIMGADTYNSQAGYQARLTDAQRRDSASQFNSNQRLQEASILGNLAGQQNAQWQQQAQMLAQFGATDREVEQARLLADRAEFDRAAADELNRLMIDLQTRGNILSSTPLMTTNTSSGNSTGTSSTSGMQFGASMNFGPRGFSFGG